MSPPGQQVALGVEPVPGPPAHEAPDEERGEGGPAGRRVHDQEAGREEDPHLPVRSAEELQDRAGNHPERKLPREVGVLAGGDGRHRHPVVGRKEARLEVGGVGHQDESGSDQQSEHLGASLGPPAGSFVVRILAFAPQDPAGLQVVAHVGERGSGRRSEPGEHDQRERREPEQHSEQQEDERGGERREPARVHR